MLESNLEDAKRLAQQLLAAVPPEVVATVQTGVDAARARLEPLALQAKVAANEALAPYEPWQIACAAILATLLATTLLLRARAWLSRTFKAGLVQTTFNFLRSLPIIRGLLQKEKDKLRKDLHKKFVASADDRITALPKKGAPPKAVLERLKAKSRRDVQLSDGRSMISGCVYMGAAGHKSFLDEAYTMFSFSNPLHPDVFPSVRQMEAEVVAMTASFLGGGPSGNTRVCGAMTSGGTESILSAVKASRDYMAATRGIVERPEMIIAQSAHAAYFKAAEYFKIKLVMVKVDSDYKLSAATVRRHMTPNTILIVASAPGFPHGLVDHVSDLSRLAHARRVCLHVDACLGGFVCPFARQLGYRVPPFDFSLPGVTSMSVDTHKFGQGHKGTSVVLYRSDDLRQHQYTCITNWTGGLYISPGIVGSRPGALIVTAWAAMVAMGHEGYLEASRAIMAAAQAFAEGVRGMLELEVIGSQLESSVVAFKAAAGKKGVDVYKLNDLMTQRGWHLNALQHPAALHFCFTAMHVSVVGDLLKDLADCVAALKAAAASGGGAAAVSGGSAPIYGMANVSPDRNLLGEFLTAYQDAMLQA